MLQSPISWCSKKENVVALSSCEVEYIASTETACQCLWLSTLLDEMKLEYLKPIQLLVDKKSAISLSKKSMCHRRSKHIETKFHLMRDQVSKGKLELVHCPTEEQVTNIFTKITQTKHIRKTQKFVGISTFRKSRFKGEC